MGKKHSDEVSMILGDLNDKNLKYTIPSNIWSALKFVRDNDLSILDDGRYEIDGDKIYINVMTVKTVCKNSKNFEIHRDYADVQILIHGQECMEFASITERCEVMSDYDGNNDFQSVVPLSNISTLNLKPNMFAVFYPNEPHKPTCNIDEERTVKKAVIKVHTSYLRKN
ncbi:N-acetylneuraminate anomerase [Vibrio ponticus]|nr:N-acetylneuraminate anomerase [Vibrio ponticus]